jgi:hypothetical protein
VPSGGVADTALLLIEAFFSCLSFEDPELELELETTEERPLVSSSSTGITALPFPTGVREVM